MRDIHLEAVDRIVASNPKASAERTLELLVGVTGASTGAVFVLDGDRHRLFVGRSIDQSALDRVQEVWSGEKERAALRAGTPYVGGEPYAVMPLASQRSVVGLLYLAAERRLGPHFPDQVAAVERLLVSSILAGESPVDSSIDTYLRRTPAHDIEREKLILSLNQHEWNISRVAREYGVSRVTIYQKMRKHGIERQRISKSIRKPSPATS